MTGNKRFTYSPPFDGFCDVYDNGKLLSCMRLEYVENTVNRLNGLNNENKQLKYDKQQLHRAMSRKEVRYKQFKNKVFDLIDKKIKELSTTTKYGDIHEDLRIFAQQVLYDLKKELSE